MQPIYVTSYGRSGSTLIMRILGAHASVCIRNMFPYETRTSQYFFLRYKEGQRFPNFTPILHDHVEYSAYHYDDIQSACWADYHRQAELGSNGMALTQEYYRYIACFQGAAEPHYFAEKTMGLGLLNSIAQAIPVRAVFIRRDPRDIFISVKHYNRKTGVVGFGEQEGNEALLTNILGFLKEAATMAAAMGGNAVTVQYENFITDSNASIRKLYEALWLAADPWQITQAKEIAFQDDAQARGHRSSNSHKQSVQRWRQHLTSDIEDLFEQYAEQIEEATENA